MQAGGGGGYLYGSPGQLAYSFYASILNEYVGIMVGTGAAAVAPSDPSTGHSDSSWTSRRPLEYGAVKSSNFAAGCAYATSMCGATSLT